MNHLSLFTGIGGIDLAAEWAGFQTVGQCEWADYPTKVLEKHWPNVPRWRDVRDVTRDSFRARTGMDTVDLISGGYPCQPFSLAGKRRGKDDERYLWPEMFRIIRELRPRWVLGENVAGHIRNGLDDVLGDLESEGYSARPFVLQAQAVGAPHRRERVFIVAYSNREGLERYNVNGSSFEGKIIQTDSRTTCGLDGKGTGYVAYASDERNVRWNGKLSADDEVAATRRDYGTGTEAHDSRKWWAVEPDVGRVAHGVPNRVDRLKCLGNAVVPQQVYPILKAIAEAMKHDIP